VRSTAAATHPARTNAHNGIEDDQEKKKSFNRRKRRRTTQEGVQKRKN
jgi:hypothetical protein